MSDSSVKANPVNSTHTFTKHDLKIDIECKLENITASSHFAISTAYNNFIQTITEHANDYDILQAQMAQTSRKHTEIIGPF